MLVCLGGPFLGRGGTQPWKETHTLQEAEGSSVRGELGCSPLYPGMGSSLMPAPLCRATPRQAAWLFPSVSGSKNGWGGFVLAFCAASIPFLCLNSVPIALPAVLEWSGLKKSSKRERFPSPLKHAMQTTAPHCWHSLKHSSSTLCHLEIMDSVVQGPTCSVWLMSPANKAEITSNCAITASESTWLSLNM